MKNEPFDIWKKLIYVLSKYVSPFYERIFKTCFIFYMFGLGH